MLPLCAIALKDADDEVRMSGGEGIRQIARAVAETLPDPATSNPETKAFDPFEAKVKWLLLQPVLTALNANVSSLKDGMTAKKFDARLTATKAAEAVSQARSLALASRRYPPDDLRSFVKNVPPEDALKTGAMSVLPSLAERLDDESAEIRLVAIEGFEHQGLDARSYLNAIIRASTNDDLFVRWVAARTLGGLFDGASPAQSAQIVKALAARTQDADLDVRMAALTAIGKGDATAKPATAAVLKLALDRGDPDQCVEAIKTLTKIHAEPSETVKGVAGILNSSEPAARKQAAIYLGSLGHAARAALPQLRPLLLDTDPDVRKEAAKALLAIE